MNTNATHSIFSESDAEAPAGSYPAAAPAVFVFDPATGNAMSMNTGAIDLISRFGLDKAPRLSLAVIERGIMADGKTKSEPVLTDGLGNGTSELRRICRRSDGSVLALSRVWAPGSSTMLVVEDMTAAEQDRRRRRIWDMMVSKLSQSENVATVLTKALRIFCLLSRSPSGEIWLSEGSALTRRSMRMSKDHVGTTQTASRLKSADDSLVGRAWSSEKPVYDESRVALPIHAGERLVAVLVLGASPHCPSDYMVFSLIEGLAPLFGLALFIFRQSEEMQGLRAQMSDAAPIESSRARSSTRPKPMSVVAGMRAAG
ncbi:MAG: GAF domain-containing protein [Parvibaculaceae bacterium]